MSAGLCWWGRVFLAARRGGEGQLLVLCCLCDDLSSGILSVRKFQKASRPFENGKMEKVSIARLRERFPRKLGDGFKREGGKRGVCVCVWVSEIM